MAAIFFKKNKIRFYVMLSKKLPTHSKNFNVFDDKATNYISIHVFVCLFISNDILTKINCDQNKRIQQKREKVNQPRWLSGFMNIKFK